MVFMTYFFLRKLLSEIVRKGHNFTLSILLHLWAMLGYEQQRKGGEKAHHQKRSQKMIPVLFLFIRPFMLMIRGAAGRMHLRPFGRDFRESFETENEAHDRYRFQLQKLCKTLNIRTY